MSDDIHALSGAYAVDALDDVERAQFEQHLAACAACSHEVASLREAAALLAETTVLAPPAQVRERVLAGIGAVRPLPPVVAPDVPVGAHRAVPSYREVATVTPLAPRRRRRGARLLAAAAAVVVIGGGGVALVDRGNDSAPPSNVARTVMTAPDHQTFTQQLDNGATATVYRSKKLNQAVLVTRNMPAAATGTEFVLWLQHDGVLVEAGVLPHAADNTVVLSGDAASATGAGITVEDAGTQPTTPSADLVGSIPFQET